MINTGKDGITAECDRCTNAAHARDESIESITDFKEFVEYLKGLGWRIKKVATIWIHHCPACALALKGQVDDE